MVVNGIINPGMMVFVCTPQHAQCCAPFMIKELNLSPTVTGVLLSAFFWLYSFMQMPRLAVDRFGVKTRLCPWFRYLVDRINLYSIRRWIG